jgi:hypothetical protein
MMRRRVALLAAVVGAFWLLPQGAFGAQPLTGEIAAIGAVNQNFMNVQCNRTGVSTFSFDASGDIVGGPYLGTISVSVSGSFGPQNITVDPQLGPYFGLSVGPMLTYHETFTIDSPSSATTITGTKDGVLAPPPTPFFGDARPAVCGEFSDTPQGSGYTNFIETYTNYDARIDAPDGVFRDHGFAFVEAADFFVQLGQGDTQGLGFTQAWQSTSFGRAAPTTADDCKNGGWRNYPELGFKNQGDCVSYVATGGRNPPAGG